MHSFRMVLSPVFSHSRWTVARFIFIIVYKYHLFALFFLFIYRFFKPYLIFWHLSQLVNMYCPTWEVHIYHTTFHRWRFGGRVFVPMIYGRAFKITSLSPSFNTVSDGIPICDEILFSQIQVRITTTMRRRKSVVNSCLLQMIPARKPAGKTLPVAGIQRR